MNRISKSAGLLAVATAVTAGALSFGNKEKAEIDDCARLYEFGVGPNNCSRYVKVASANLFGKNYSHSDAWDRRYNDKVVAPVADFSGLETMINSGVLQPGMVVGVFNPRSSYLNERDKTGNQVAYTHNILYIGECNGEPRFIDLFGLNFRNFTLEGFAEMDLKPVEILDAKN